MLTKNCHGCGAPAIIHDPAVASYCPFCGTQVHVPDEPEPPDPAEIQRQRIQNDIEKQRNIARKSEALLIAAFLGLAVPGIVGAAVSCPLLAVNGQTVLAFVVGGLCFPFIILGLTLGIYFAKKKEQAEKRVKELQAELGMDVRSLGEKIIDKVFGNS